VGTAALVCPGERQLAGLAALMLLYHVCVHRLAERVLAHIRQQELLSAGDRIGVAVSGGIDSVALLRLLLELRHELGIVVSVLHFNHKLRGAESEADQEFVSNLARTNELELHVDGDDVAIRAAEERISLETAARDLRYGFFHHLLGAEGRSRNPTGTEAPSHTGSENRSAESAAPPKGDPQGLKPSSFEACNGTAEAVPFPNSLQTPFLNKVATGHTLDDQAETVLMRVIRGSGMRGLGGIHPRLAVEDDYGEMCGEIVRPLLTIPRLELQRYLVDLGQGWREDSTNADERFTRNRVRKLVVPLLEKEFNPSVAENLAELAEIARGEEDYWDNEVSGWLGTVVQWSEPDWAREATSRASLIQIGAPGDEGRRGTDLQSRIDAASWLVMNGSISRFWFLGEPVAVQRRLIKAVGDHAGIPMEFKHVEEILRFATQEGASGKELSLPLGWRVVREPDELLFLTPDLGEPQPRGGGDYEYDLGVPGRVAIRELGYAIEARPIGLAGEEAGYNPEHLLDAESLPGSLRVRNWRPGDRFWPAHTKTPKKIKELLQERHVAQPERRFWPVVVSGNEIVWLHGFGSALKFVAKPRRETILIQVIPLALMPAT
jgi:tRNA(Ile)-lysidine synthase